MKLTPSSKATLLIVSTFFPPMNHIASRRIYAFAKYLSENYEVIVVTSTDNASYQQEVEGFKVIYLNSGLSNKIISLNKNDNRLIHLSKLMIRKTLISFNLGFHLSWKRKAKAQILSLLNTKDVSYILSSYMPVEPHDICYEVLTSCERFDSIYWIADMRDEMSEHTTLNKIQKKFYKKLETKYSGRANLITAVSEPILNQFKENMSDRQQFLEVRNGYNHEIVTSHNYTNKLKIGYFGNFYADRKPSNFFKALSSFEHINDIEVIIASNNHNYEVPKNVRNHVKQIEFVPYEESIKLIGSMDCNLLILPYTKGNEGVYSGKLFDYLSTGRPILGLINENDVAANLIREYGCDYLADPNDVEGILSTLKALHKDWSQQRLKSANQSKTKKLHRKEQVEILKRFLQEYQDNK